MKSKSKGKSTGVRRGLRNLPVHSGSEESEPKVQRIELMKVSGVEYKSSRKIYFLFLFFVQELHTSEDSMGWQALASLPVFFIDLVNSRCLELRHIAVNIYLSAAMILPLPLRYGGAWLVAF